MLNVIFAHENADLLQQIMLHFNYIYLSGTAFWLWKIFVNFFPNLGMRVGFSDALKIFMK